MSKKFTQEEFVVKATDIHDNKYDYSKTIYVTQTKKVIITCQKHGDFLQKPCYHLRGQGCPECAKLNNGPRQVDTAEDFIAKAQLSHGERYDYSEVEYVRSWEKVKIICKKHGAFMQRPSQHIRGSNCPACVKEQKDYDQRKIKDQADFVQQATATHEGKYSYENVVFINSRTHVAITCPIHGDFMQAPYNHVAMKQGCRQCHIDTHRVIHGDMDKFLKQAHAKHGDTYDYSKVVLKRSTDPIEIICKKHGSFWMQPNTHLTKSMLCGCPKCNNSLGEQRIDKYMVQHSLPFVAQYRDHRCIAKRRLPFDFAVFHDKECIKLRCLIEFDGRQHFETVKAFGGAEQHKELIEHDKLKNEYCLTNSIKLIRIPYYEMNNINSILDKELQIES